MKKLVFILSITASFFDNILSETPFPKHNGNFNIFENTYQFDHAYDDDPMVLAIRKLDFPEVQKLIKNIDPKRLLEKLEIWDELRIEVKCNYIGLALANLIYLAISAQVSDNNIDSLYQIVKVLKDNGVSINEEYQWLYYRCPDNFWSNDVHQAIIRTNAEILTDLIKSFPDPIKTKFKKLLETKKELLRIFTILRTRF